MSEVELDVIPAKSHPKSLARVSLGRANPQPKSLAGVSPGKSELPLAVNGIKQVQGTGDVLVGSGKLIDPAKIAHVFCSPRKRALSTLDMLLGDARKEDLAKEGKLTITEDIAEWDYGDHEGLKLHEIHSTRKEKGLDKDKGWNIWTDGCEGGESAEEVRVRLDRLIQKIHEIQEPHMHGGQALDVLLVAHGHILRAFTKRWLKHAMEFPFTMMMEPGAIGIMSYAHHNISEPAVLIGMGFPLPA